MYKCKVSHRTVKNTDMNAKTTCNYHHYCRAQSNILTSFIPSFDQSSIKGCWTWLCLGTMSGHNQRLTACEPCNNNTVQSTLATHESDEWTNQSGSFHCYWWKQRQHSSAHWLAESCTARDKQQQLPSDRQTHPLTITPWELPVLADYHFVGRLFGSLL